jgi:hypothetical protein
MEGASERPGPKSPLTPTLPSDVHFDGHDEKADVASDRHVFNEFAWQEFIYLNWPAQDGKHGEPDSNKKLGDQSDFVVWQSWKSLHELFPANADANPPSAWDDSEQATDARRKSSPGQITLKEVNQFGPGGVPKGPLIAQNGTYVRYEIRVNRVAYEFIRTNKYYLKKNLPHDPTGKGRVEFPSGSIIVKAAWMELTDRDDRQRFYQAQAKLMDGVKDSMPVVRQASVGLVGLHIARKTETRPSWIWATFEHVDNTEPGPGGRRASFSQNDPTKPTGPVNVPPKMLPDGSVLPFPADQPPVEVSRWTSLDKDIVDANDSYHARDGIKRTIWENYRLVGTQWVPTPDPGDPLANPLRRLPEDKVGNMTIETYAYPGSCIQCHISAPDFKFVFFPSYRAR